MFLRYLDWRRISPNEQCKVFMSRNGNKKYLAWAKDEGIMDIRDKDDAYFILRNNEDVELSHEHYGFTFNGGGDQVDDAQSVPDVQVNEGKKEDASRAEADEEIPSSPKRRGRPKGSKNKGRVSRHR